MILFRRIFGGLLLVVGSVQLLWCMRNTFQAVLATRWPTVQGTIESSRVEEQAVHISGGHGTAYIPKVSYTYQVAGLHYSGHRIYFTDGNALPFQAQKIMEEFPAGAIVTVHIDPSDPASSLLQLGLYTTDFSGLGLASSAIILGSLFTYWARINSFKSRPI